MTIVDAHCHVGLQKYEPVERLLEALDREAISQAVLIQYGGAQEHDYLADCLARHPGRFAAVMNGSLPTSDAAEIVRQHRQGFRGMRLRPGSVGPGNDLFLPWRIAEELGWAVSVQGRPEEFLSETFAGILRRFPRLTLVLEHLGGAQPEEPPAESELRRVFALARQASVFIKLPGPGELTAAPYSLETVGQLYRDAVQAFSPTRVMWGSDWPRVLAREGYARALSAAMEALETFSASDRAEIFGGTARRVWQTSGGHPRV